MRFIRKNGRVIPIRDEEPSKPIHAGKLYLAGIGTSLVGTGAGLAYNNSVKENFASPKHFNKSIAKFRENYPLEFARAGKPPIAEGFVASVQFLHPSHVKPFVTTNTSNEHLLLHELGHIASSREKGTANRLIRKYASGTRRAYKTTGKVSAFRRMALTAALPFLSLKSEAEATKFAFKAAYKKGGVRLLAKSAKYLAPAYGTYGLLAVGSAMSDAGIGLAVKHLFQRKKKSDG